MLLSLLQKRRRRRLLATPFPESWHEIIRRNVRLFATLSPREQSKLCDDLRILVAEKNWEGCGGLTMSDEIKVTVAAQASLLLLGLKHNYFSMVKSILVYPDAYVAPDQTITKGGLVLEGESHREGEAWYLGPVILSWNNVLAAGRGKGDGSNLVLHEFAHQLDMQNGRTIDGTPPLDSAQQYDRWQRIVKSEYQRLQRDCELGRYTVLDCYGASHIGELFAVATEAFFERPQEMRLQHPELYQVMRDYFHQDPAARLAG
jgi:hypothetical protein